MGEQKFDAVGSVWEILRERDRTLLSRNTCDPTVGSIRDKKENCSTRRGLRVSTRFWEFPQTPRGRGFSLLGFYTLFKCFSMFRLASGLERPFDRSQTLGSN